MFEKIKKFSIPVLIISAGILFLALVLYIASVETRVSNLQIEIKTKASQKDVDSHQRTLNILTGVEEIEEKEPIKK